jgi:hypothetical protein
VTPVALATIFADAERRLIAHVQALAARLDADEDVWPAYCTAVSTLKGLVGEARTPLLTTQEVAAKFQVSSRTVRAKARRLGLEAVRLGERGRGAIRWRSA